MWTLALDRVRQMGAREPGSIVMQTSSNLPNLEMLPNANKALLHQAQQTYQRQIDYGQAQETYWRKFGTLSGFDQAFNDENPANTYVIQGFRDAEQPIPLPDSESVVNKDWVPFLKPGDKIIYKGKLGTWKGGQ